jgi:hypothetical protein
MEYFSLTIHRGKVIYFSGAFALESTVKFELKGGDADRKVGPDYRIYPADHRGGHRLELHAVGHGFF